MCLKYSSKSTNKLNDSKDNMDELKFSDTYKYVNKVWNFL